MRGQVSLELLLVTLIALSALVIWLQGVNSVRSATLGTLNAQAEKIAADRIAGAVNAVCLMGDGNNRLVRVFFPVETRIYFGEKLFIGNKTRSVYCEVISDSYLEGSVSLRITNKEGRITFQQT